jgi:transposase
MKAELKQAVLATGSTLMDIHGIGPAGAARILADVGDVARFPDRGHFAPWTGTAPIDALRRRLSDVVYRQLVHDAAVRAIREAGPGGHSGASMSSSAADLTPVIGSSDQPLPGPAQPTLPPHADPGNPDRPGTGAPPRRRAAGVNVSAQPDERR